MNKIEDVRAEILKYFDPRNSIAGSLENTYSPNNKYRLQTSEFKQTKPDLNWVATKVDIFDNLTGGQLFDFIANERFFHCWVSANDHDYLLCAEDMCGGQTVIDLTERQMASYSPDNDGFIWAEFSLSPDGKTLATTGCVWACPFEMRIYDFQNPMNLPLREIKAIELIDGERFAGWVDNKNLRVKPIHANHRTSDRVISVD